MTTLPLKHWHAPVLHPGMVDVVLKSDPGVISFVSALVLWLLLALAVLVQLQH